MFDIAVATETADPLDYSWDDELLADLTAVSELDWHGDEPVSIPAGLDTMEPGLMLAAVLSSIDVHALSGHGRIVVLRARQRMASHYAAHLYDDITAVADVIEEDFADDPEVANDATAAEIRAALHLTRRAANSELQMAHDLRRRLPRVWQALRAGDIDARRARAIAHSTGHLSPDVAEDLVDRLIDDAPNLTTGQLIARIRRLAIDVAPDEAKQRYDTAVDQRRVVMRPTEDGTANLFGLDLPPDRVASASAHIDRIARHLRRRKDGRTIDQLRADVMLDLLNGDAVDGSGNASRGRVEITVDLTTLAGLDDNAADLAGYGPVIADIARQVADANHDAQWGAQWAITVTDPDTGLPVHTGVSRRRPTTATARAVRARYRRCIFPGCRMPATHSDLDHRIPWEHGGPTTPANLAPLCRHDHRIRHHAGWTYTPNPDATITWTTHLSHAYTTSGRSP